MTTSFGGLAKILVAHEVVTPDAMTKALAESEQQKISLVPFLVENKLAPANKIARVLSHEFGDPLFDLNALDKDVIPKDLVDEKIVNRYGVLPLFKRGQRLFIGLSDPTRLDAVDAIAFNANLAVETIVVEEDKLRRMIESVYSGGGDFASFDNIDLSGEMDEGADEEDEGVDVDGGTEDAPIVKFVNKMLLDAIRMGA